MSYFNENQEEEEEKYLDDEGFICIKKDNGELERIRCTQNIILDGERRLEEYKNKNKKEEENKEDFIEDKLTPEERIEREKKGVFDENGFLYIETDNQEIRRAMAKYNLAVKLCPDFMTEEEELELFSREERKQAEREEEYIKEYNRIKEKEEREWREKEEKEDRAWRKQKAKEDKAREKKKRKEERRKKSFFRKIFF